MPVYFVPPKSSVKRAGDYTKGAISPVITDEIKYEKTIDVKPSGLTDKYLQLTSYDSVMAFLLKGATGILNFLSDATDYAGIRLMVDTSNYATFAYNKATNLFDVTTTGGTINFDNEHLKTTGNLTDGTYSMNIAALQTALNNITTLLAASHARSHALDGTLDHSIGSLTSTYLVKSDGTKLVPATNIDSDVADAVTKKHATGGDTALGTLGTKNPPIDADKVIYRDSIASDGLVTSTWTQVIAFLKTTFDTYYNLYVHPDHSGDVASTGDGATVIGAEKVTKAMLGSPVQAQMDDAIWNNAVLAFHVLTHTGQAYYGMEDGWMDEFEDETGIDTATSTYESYDPTGDRYSPLSGWDGYTKSMLHMNGTDASTTFTDEIGLTWTAAGNAQIDTGYKKFGTASGLFDGTGDYIDTPDTADHEPAAGDFTIDYQVRFSSVSGTQVFFGRRTSVPAQKDLFTFYFGSNVLTFQAIVNTVVKAQYTCSWTPLVNTWYHLEIVRNGANFYIFIDGVSQNLTVVTAISTNDLTFSLTGEKLTIGRYGDYADYYFFGWIDEFRFSKGIARHTANFTAPIAEYEASPQNAMTLISNAFTASSAPAEALVTVIAEDADDDIAYYVSRDNGATYTQVTMTDIATFGGNVHVYRGKVDISGQPSGTSMRLKAVTQLELDYIDGWSCSYAI